MSFTSPVPASKSLEQRIAAIIKSSDANKPRSRQLNIGPSEIGDACVRKLAYKMMDTPKINTVTDPWPAISGTAIHSWLADAFGETSDGNWLIEHRVTARPGLTGTVDLFDVDNGIVIDHKCVGAASMKARKLEGPTQQQLIQLSIYAYGLKQAGYDVKQIALAFYPLGGMLSGLHVWIRDYDEQIAIDAMQRLDDTISLLVMLDPEENPQHWNLIPFAPSRLCHYCPWYTPENNDLSKGCAGK